MNNNNESPFKVLNIFPTPIYIAKRETEVSTPEMEDIKRNIEKAKTRIPTGDGAFLTHGHWMDDSYIFNNTGLNSLKKFCEQHIRIYANEVINPKNHSLDFYITQSWINVVRPGGESHPPHCHRNSIISGVFYISVVKEDTIQFYDPNIHIKNRIEIEAIKSNEWNATTQSLSITTNALVLFPSWLIHGVKENRSTTTDRISISFNVFVKGTIGEVEMMTELIL